MFNIFFSNKTRKLSPLIPLNWVSESFFYWSAEIGPDMVLLFVAENCKHIQTFHPYVAAFRGRNEVNRISRPWPSHSRIFNYDYNFQTVVSENLSAGEKKKNQQQ